MPTKIIEGQTCIHLQFYGYAPAIPAGELKPGTKMIWNFGTITTCTRIVKETKKTITIIDTTKEGVNYTRKLLKTRLVAIVEK